MANKFKRFGESNRGIDNLERLNIFIGNLQNDINRVNDSIQALNIKLVGIKTETKNLDIKYLNPIRRYLKNLSDEITEKRRKIKVKLIKELEK